MWEFLIWRTNWNPLLSCAYNLIATEVCFANQLIWMQINSWQEVKHEDLKGQLFVWFKCKACNRRSQVWATIRDGEGREQCQDKFSCNTVCTGSLKARGWKKTKETRTHTERERMGRKEGFVSCFSMIVVFILTSGDLQTLIHQIKKE